MKLSIHIKTKPPKEKIDNSFEEFGVFGCCLSVFKYSYLITLINISYLGNLVFLFFHYVNS